MVRHRSLRSCSLSVWDCDRARGEGKTKLFAHIGCANLFPRVSKSGPDTHQKSGEMIIFLLIASDDVAIRALLRDLVLNPSSRIFYMRKYAQSMIYIYLHIYRKYTIYWNFVCLCLTSHTYAEHDVVGYKRISVLDGGSFVDLAHVECISHTCWYGLFFTAWNESYISNTWIIYIYFWKRILIQIQLQYINTFISNFNIFIFAWICKNLNFK